MRLLAKLGREGQVKNIKVVLKHPVRDTAKMKTLHFVCNPEVSEENTIIQSAIEQAKMKFNIPPRTAAMIKEETEFQADSVRSSVDAVLELEGAAVSSPVKPSKTATLRFGRKYGLQPKFVKMRELHLLLFYLIHGYSGDEELDQQEALAHLKQDREGSLGEREEEELGKMR